MIQVIKYVLVWKYENTSKKPEFSYKKYLCRFYESSPGVEYYSNDIMLSKMIRYICSYNFNTISFICLYKFLLKFYVVY